MHILGLDLENNMPRIYTPVSRRGKEIRYVFRLWRKTSNY